VSLATLRDLLVDLDDMSGVERTREARRLSDIAMKELAAAGDEGVYEATRTASRAEVAEAMGVSVSSVNKALRRYGRSTKVTAGNRP
jgi:predicted DNA binding protein